MDFKLDAGTAARMIQQAEDERQRAYMDGFNGVRGGPVSGPSDGEFFLSMGELAKAITQGAVLPLEFKALVDQYMPANVAKAARYESRDSLMARMSGATPPRQPAVTTDSATPRRRMEGVITPMPEGDVTTRIPNAYGGQLDDEEPRLAPPRTMWGA